jgi:hypothetical protein
MKRGINTSFLARCAAKIIAESGVAKGIGRREHNQG